MVAPLKTRLTALAFATGLALFALLLCMSAAQPVQHDDVFWHLRTAQWVIEKGEVPRVDHFTHTVLGEPWTSHEWGFALVLFGPYALGGFPGLVALTALLTALAFAFTFAHMRRYLPPQRASLAVPLLLLGWAPLLRSALVLRAGLLSSVFLAALCALLERLHSTRDRRWMIPVVALIWIWANCHTAVLFGLAIIGSHLVQALWDLWRAQRDDFWRSAVRGVPAQRARLLAGCMALTLVNPNGIDLWTFPFRLNQLLYHSDLKWGMGQFAPPTLRAYPFFYVAIAAVLLACLPWSRLWAVLGDPRKPAVAQALGLLFFLGMALRSNRFVMDFVVMALPFLALLWGTPTTPTQDTRLSRLGDSAWAHACNIALVGLGFGLTQPHLPRAALGETVPQALVRFIEQEHISGRMFNYEAIGGYLGFRLRQPVYWDGRCDIYGKVASEFAYSEDYGHLFARHHIDFLILGSDYYARMRSYLASHRELWGLVYLDDRYALALKRVPQFQQVLARSEYHALEPFHLPSEEALHGAAQDPVQLAQLNQEAMRVLTHNSDAFLGWYVRGELARERGDLPAAQQQLSRAAQLIENSQVLYDLARVAHDLGHDDEARRLLQRTIALTQH